ncbi:hypothetical protein KUTeg_000912 [Tegillarca granosa]|uniref:PHD-type domain-containing protein n=1 Tax=Tegillarca granosa TaxID=220873 RepID=A0ABQ9FZG3_TEGGR|nr:hypothetical protein KUTeg_000912 [Tegillarca granosa]
MNLKLLQKSLVCEESTSLIENLQMCNMPYKTASDLAENQPILNEDDISYVNKFTIGQSQNVNWHNLRHGRLTASKFYNIFTRINTHLENPNSDMTSLLSTVMGYSPPNPNLKALKFGRESEPIAKSLYKREYVKSHSETCFSECGIFLDANNSYLAASPDMLVSCSCCGNGLLEVKTIMAPKCDTCFAFCYCNLPSFFYNCNNSLNIKKNHSYFCQMQGQMAITHRNWCDLFVYSVNGSYKERVYFDKDYYDKIFVNLKYFFKTFVAPEIFSKSLQKSQSESKSAEPMDVEANTYFCILCNCQIQEQENIKSFWERSICCDMCDRWYHFKCVNMTKATLYKIKDWICQTCNQSLQ